MYVIPYPQASDDLDTEIKHIEVSSPYIIVTSTDDDSRQYFLVVEKMILVESNMTAALQDLMSIYFSFNIAYPRPVYLVLLFLQHHVFGIKDNQTVPNIVKIVYGAMCA